MNDIITNEEMAQYMNQVLNSETLKKAYCSCEKAHQANDIFKYIGNVVAKYYISTGDNSLESAEKLINSYMEVGRDRNIFYETTLMKMIEEKVATILELEGYNSLSDRIKIQEYVDLRNKNNSFYTHCFPGALYEEISTNGLDISKELFKDEYEILSQCFKTSFQMGNLNYCELSEASLSYATMGMPERARFSIGSNIIQNAGENIHQAAERALRENLQNQLNQGNIDESKMREMYEAGKRIIDFYCVSKSGIAFFRDEVRTNKTNIKEYILKGLSDFKYKIRDTYIANLFETSIIDNDEESYEKVFKEIVTLYPDSKEWIEAHIENNLINYMSEKAIKNYTYAGFADGYVVKGGKMSPNEFAISMFTTPSEVFALHNENTQENQISNENNRTHKSIENNNYSDVQKKLCELDLNFKKILDMTTSPEKIEMISIQNKRVVIATINGEKVVMGYPLLEKTANGEVYSSFLGNIEGRVINSISCELEELPQEEIDKIVEEYKKNNPDYDESLLEGDALDWYAKKKFEQMDESQKKQAIKEEYESRDKFSVFEKDGKTVASFIRQGNIEGIYEAETLYDKNGGGKYNRLFEAIRDEKMPLAKYHSDLYETETYKRMQMYSENKSPEVINNFNELFELVNQLYIEARQSMGFVGFGNTGAIQKIKKNPNISKIMKDNPRAFELLKYLADEEERKNKGTKMTYLSASVRICNECKNDYIEPETGEIE